MRTYVCVCVSVCLSVCAAIGEKTINITKNLKDLMNVKCYAEQYRLYTITAQRRYRHKIVLNFKKKTKLISFVFTYLLENE